MTFTDPELELIFVALHALKERSGDQQDNWRWHQMKDLMLRIADHLEPSIPFDPPYVGHSRQKRR